MHSKRGICIKNDEFCKDEELDGHGMQWLDNCMDLAPSVTEVFRRPRGGDARVDRDQRRAALLEGKGGSGSGGHNAIGAVTARGRLQSSKTVDGAISREESSFPIEES